MCGGAGVRLWPASSPARPKQFAPLFGERSTFQDVITRIAGLPGAADCVVVAGVAHADIIRQQLAEIGSKAQLLLEPQPRDSAAAMCAAAAWIAARDPDGVAVVLSADHHVPDGGAFVAACAEAVEAARDDGVVTLGVRPTWPSPAYGYIHPSEAQAGRPGRAVPVLSFVEKPKPEVAESYLAAGYLWNSGNFVARASVLLEEFAAYAPAVLEAANAALQEGAPTDQGLVLGPSFVLAPKISVDYAVMEKTRRAKVVPVDFAWSDVGAWDAVLALSDRDADGNSVQGQATLVGVSDSLVKVAPGQVAAVVGVSDVAVVVEGPNILVCGLQASQSVKTAVDRLEPRRMFADLDEASQWCRRWLFASALPIWSTLGVDHEAGGYRERLTLTGDPVDAPRRGRLQGRQIYAFATGGLLGWQGPWRQAALEGVRFLKASFLRPDGLFRTLVARDGSSLDDAAAFYDQTFALLGLATLSVAAPEIEGLRALADGVREGLESLRVPAGGFREIGDLPYQSNPHMHLFEACLAWDEAGVEPWGALADEVAELALDRFIDQDSGYLLEFFEADWTPAHGEAGRRVDVGHQFEWAWLLHRWGSRRGRPDAVEAARRLYRGGRKGVDPKRNCAMNELWTDSTVKDPVARLWPQTEHLKAALVLGTEQEALEAANCLRTYLETPVAGVWRDRLRPDGGFMDEAAPGTSLYHLICAIQELARLHP